MAAKHPKQRALATEYGATQVIAPATSSAASAGLPAPCGSIPSTARPTCSAGSTSTLECSGVGDSMRRFGSPVPAAASCSAGLPTTSPDLTALWFRELSLVGAYAADPIDMTAALDLAAASPAVLDALVGARYPLERWRDALDHALVGGPARHRPGRLRTARALEIQRQQGSTSTGRIHS